MAWSTSKIWPKKDEFKFCLFIKWTEWNSRCHKAYIWKAWVLFNQILARLVSFLEVKRVGKGRYTAKLVKFGIIMQWPFASNLLLFSSKLPKRFPKVICSRELLPLLDHYKPRQLGICSGMLPTVIWRPTDRICPKKNGSIMSWTKNTPYYNVFHFIIVLFYELDKIEPFRPWYQCLPGNICTTEGFYQSGAKTEYW